MFDSSSPDESKLVLDRFIDNLPGLAYRCEPDPPWEMTFIRGQVESLTGYPSAAFERGDLAYGTLIEHELETVERAVEEGIDAQRQFTVRYRIRTRSGDRKHVLERGSPVVQDGDVIALEGIIVEITQQKEYEQHLERQNDLFSKTQQMASVGGWEYDTRREELRWTDQVKRIHGIALNRSPSVDEALEFYHPDDRPVMREAVIAAFERGEPFDHELRIITNHDEQRWVRARGVPQIVDGEVIRVRGALQDITDRRERERSLRDEQAVTKSMFEALPDLLYTFDEDGSFSRWNERVQSTTGYSDDEIASMHPLDFVADRDRGRVRTHIEKVLQEETTTTVEANLKTKDGDTIPYEFTGGPLHNDGARQEVVGVGRDISGRIERQRRFEAVFNNTYQFTGLLDPDGTIIEVNEAGLSFAEADRQAVIGTTLLEMLEFSTESSRESVIWGLERARDGDPYQDTLRIRGADGEATITFSIRPITDDDGDVLFLVPEGRDITERQERERLLQVLHRLLRHNLRNDLTAIRGYTDTLIESLSDEALKAYAENVDDASENLLTTSEKAKQMVNLILRSPAETKRLEVGAVTEAVSERLQRRYPDATIEVSVDGEVTVACTERIEIAIEQCIENGLEHNASSVPRVRIDLSERANEGVIEITDNGRGIADDEWSMVDEEIRDEPSQLRHGNGIGLLLTRWVVDEFDGSLEYTTTETGSTVTIRLPKS